MMKTSLTGLKLILFMLFCSPMFLAVILFSLNILWDYLLSALLCLVNCIISFWLFYLSYYKPNILSIEGLLCFDILLFFYNFDNETYNGGFYVKRVKKIWRMEIILCCIWRIMGLRFLLRCLSFGSWRLSCRNWLGITLWIWRLFRRVGSGATCLLSEIESRFRYSHCLIFRLQLGEYAKGPRGRVIEQILRQNEDFSPPFYSSCDCKPQSSIFFWRHSWE